jgi:hypothetical protein
VVDGTDFSAFSDVRRRAIAKPPDMPLAAERGAGPVSIAATRHAERISYEPD